MKANQTINIRPHDACSRLQAQEDFRNRKAEQEGLAFAISRFSPASAYQLTVMNLAGTNIDLKTRTAVL